MTHRILIAGAGIGGLAAALACARAGCQVTVVEAAAQLGEAGAGIQLGPNAMHVLADWGLAQAVQQVSCRPEAIVIADAESGKPISRMLLGGAVLSRDGQPYVSLHRADLHALLLRAAYEAGVAIHTNQALQNYEHSAQCIQGLGIDSIGKYDALIGADGLWSKVRAQMLCDGAPRATGHAAYRALVPASSLPEALRTPHVNVWWARDVHVVSYPVRSGALWNLVVLAESHKSDESKQSGWDLSARSEQVMQLFKQIAPDLQTYLQAGHSEGWKRWNLFDREPLAASQMARGRVALLGDAAHPMLPYLAQGAAMAIEDAAALASGLKTHSDALQALHIYAQARASRNARVVRTAQRNGRIFHLSGPLAAARNAVLILQGTQTLSMPWLYGYRKT
jgi:salicylate hydroxylase